MIPFYVMAQLCSSVLGFAEFYSCQWDDTMPTLHSGIQLEPAVAQLVLVQDMHSSWAGFEVMLTTGVVPLVCFP